MKNMARLFGFVVIAVLLISVPTIFSFLNIVVSDEVKVKTLVDIHSDPFKAPLWKMTRGDLIREIPHMSGKELGQLIQIANDVARNSAFDELNRRISSSSLDEIIDLGSEVNRNIVWHSFVEKELISRMKDLTERQLADLLQTPLKDIAKEEISVRIDNGSIDPKIFMMININAS